MTTLQQATKFHGAWQVRPADETYESLPALGAYTRFVRDNSRQGTFANRDLRAAPAGDDHKGLVLIGPKGQPSAPTHHAFSQLCMRTKSPAKYIRTLPSELAADCLNYGLHVAREVEDLGVLITRTDDALSLRSVNGPDYGRVWNHQVADAMVERFGDGRGGQWRQPGLTRGGDSTLFAGEQDMWCFLVDEERRIEVPNRRDGKPGSMSRGFFVWNSEVASMSLGAAFFMFDNLCMNRTIYGIAEFSEVRIRHSSGAPARWLEEVIPVLDAYAHASPAPVSKMIADARAKVLGDKLDDFLATRFGGRADAIKAIHLVEEGRPMETLWDVSVGATALARSIPWQADRVALERDAGKVLAMVA